MVVFVTQKSLRRPIDEKESCRTAGHFSRTKLSLGAFGSPSIQCCRIDE